MSGLSLLAPVTGGQGPTSSSGGAWELLALVAALAQGIPLAWRSTHGVACAVAVLGGYTLSAAVVGLTPPFGPWVVIWSTATAPGHQRAVPGQGRRWRSPLWQALAATTATCVLIVVAEVAHPGVGASALLVLVTGLVTISALLLRADRARIAAERARGAAEERLRIARELHDAVGHGLGVIAVQSSTARMALDRGEIALAASAIGAVEAVSRAAMKETRQMLGVLTDSAERVSVDLPGISDIEALVDRLRVTGMAIQLAVPHPQPAASGTVQLCAYRVVQEALTNVLKHAPTSSAEVRLEQVGDRVVVSVASDGVPVSAGDAAVGGLGLAGLRARVSGVGGTLHVGPDAGGWLVRAELPLEGGA